MKKVRELSAHFRPNKEVHQHLELRVLHDGYPYEDVINMDDAIGKTAEFHLSLHFSGTPKRLTT